MTRPNLSVTTASAEAYFAERLYADAWDKASSANKTKALAWAARIIQSAFEWSEDACQGGVWDQRAAFAVCEEAIWLLEMNPTEYPAILTKGLASGNAGKVSASFSKEFIAPMVARSAVLVVGDLGTLCGEEYGVVKTAPLRS